MKIRRNHYTQANEKLRIEIDQTDIVYYNKTVEKKEDRPLMMIYVLRHRIAKLLIGGEKISTVSGRFGHADYNYNTRYMPALFAGT